MRKFLLFLSCAIAALNVIAADHVNTTSVSEYGPCPSALQFALLNGSNPSQVEIELQLTNSSLHLNGFAIKIGKAEGSESIQWKKVNQKYFSADGYGHVILARLEDATDQERDEMLLEYCDVLSNVDSNDKLIILEILSTNVCRFFPVLDTPMGIGKFYLDMSSCENGIYTIVAPATTQGCNFSYTGGSEPLNSWATDAPITISLKKIGNVITVADVYDFMVDGICYKINNDGTTVTVTSERETYPRYNNLSGDIVIPEVVTHDGVTYSVTAIDRNAFEGCSGITSVAIPNSLTTIGSYAFNGCNGLTTLTLTGEGAWNYNITSYAGLREVINMLNTVNIGSGITSLGGFGFDASVVNCYAVAPPTCTSSTFASYNGELHVPIASISTYFVATYWKNFNNLVNNLGKVTLDKASASLRQGEAVALTASVVPEQSQLQWSTTNPNVATVNANGLVTATGNGECDIYATLVGSHSAARAICHITVFNLSLSCSTLNMMVGEQATIAAEAVPNNINLTPVWSSSDMSVATVSNGVVTGVGAGVCDIMATVLGRTMTCQVTVTNNVTVNLGYESATIGASQLFTVYPSCTPDVPVELVATTSNPSVALVRLIDRSAAPSPGLLTFPDREMALAHVESLTDACGTKDANLASQKAIMIVGVQRGTATITVTTADGNANPAILEIKVTDVNGDYIISTSDITCIYNYLLNGNESNLDTSDVNGDGEVTTIDITLLYNMLLGNAPYTSQPTNDVITYTVNGVTFKMVRVEGGTFTMGATDEQGSNAISSEYPTHQVTLSDFSIGETEVTQELWQAVMGSNPSWFNGYGNPDYDSYHSNRNYGTNLQRPVECVSRYDCQRFITKLNRLTGKNFRMRTEAEWEYAARGGNRSQGYQYAGGDYIDDVAWYWYSIPSQSTVDYGSMSVATKLPNELGLYDMSGNVFEWCQDWYGNYSAEAQTNPTGPDEPIIESHRVARGGGWRSEAKDCRVSRRLYWGGNAHSPYVGLRLAQ